MDREDIIKLARGAGFEVYGTDVWITDGWWLEELERFAALVADAKREKLAAWMIERGFATGHGDTIKDLLKELEWQIKEREREACAKVCDELVGMLFGYRDIAGAEIAMSLRDTIRSRGEIK